jgi:two-component system response regulator
MHAGFIASHRIAMMVDKAVDLLLVEDCAEDAELALAAVKSRKLAGNIVHLADGDEAIQFICASSISANWKAENAPRVIILDLKLTRMGGLEVLQQLKAEERTRPIPVVVLTGSAEEQEMKECYHLGVNSYNATQYAQVVADIAHYWLNVNRAFH